MSRGPEREPGRDDGAARAVVDVLGFDDGAATAGGSALAAGDAMSCINVIAAIPVAKIRAMRIALSRFFIVYQRFTEGRRTRCITFR